MLIQGFTSEVIFTLYGVPQGSVLGPVLFNIYVASLSDVMKGMGVFSSSYTDDTNVRMFQSYTISHRTPEIIKEVQ